MSLRLNEIKGLLGRNDYLPVVRKVDGGCQLSLPHPRLRTADGGSRSVTYMVMPGEGVTVDGDPIDLPDYATRIVILADIGREMRSVGIDPDLVRYEVGGEEVPGFEEILPAPSDPQEGAMEERLANIIGDARLVGHTPSHEQAAREAGVLVGYQLYRHLAGVQDT